MTTVVAERRELSNGLLDRHEGADISGEPGGMFISKATRAANRVTLVPGCRRGVGFFAFGDARVVP